MMSFGEKELEALALIEPATTDHDLGGGGNTVRRTHESKVRSNFKKLARLCQPIANAYRRHRDLKASEKCLYAMSDRELRDIGAVRTEVDNAIVKARQLRKVKISKFLKAALKEFLNSRKTKTAYVHLMSMESRQLDDIGLTRGDINAALLGTKYKFANANLVPESNDNDQRRAS